MASKAGAPQSRRWSVDEAAFELAKEALPAEGGTIRFPAGTYLATGDSWRILRDHVTLEGDGPERTILETGPDVPECLVLSGYRHVGWSGTHPIDAADGGRGTTVLRLREQGDAAHFRPGALVFVRNGANRFDQDYGEFNEVAGIAGDGSVKLKLPLARDYRQALGNWAGTIKKAFTVPAAGSTVVAEFEVGRRAFIPGAGDEVSVGRELFRVRSADPGGRVRLENPGRGNSPAGTRIDAGTPAMKGRGLVLLAASTRDFACTGLTLRGRRKALDLSNSYRSAFSQCSIERVPGEARVSGGIVIDGDDGRFATFTGCTIRAEPSCGMQFARSFGDVAFDHCRFINAGAVFSEFCFNASVTGSSFEVRGGPLLEQVVIVGHSCGAVRISGNSIRARGVKSVFDAVTDIQSFDHRGEGSFVISGNTVDCPTGTVIFALGEIAAEGLGSNAVNGPGATSAGGGRPRP